MDDETRKVGDYEIINSIHIGDKELILGENLNAPDGNYYLVGYCEKNELFDRYEECLVGDDFVELAEIYAERLAKQIQKVKEEHEKISTPMDMMSWEVCTPMHECGDIENKIVVVRPSVLRPEHRLAQKQIYLAKSGNGVKDKSMGTAVFCYNIYSSKHTRFERHDFIGVLKPENYPDWLPEKLNQLEKTEQKHKSKSSKEVER